MNVLSVLIPTRERLNLTLKCIDSIHENTTHFDKINIYLFDNYSDPSPERFIVMSNLIKNKKIAYYSYDTNISTNNVFPKIIAHDRWHYMMMLYDQVQKKYNPDVNNYYMICDNDMLFGPEWDEYFLSGAKYVDKTFPKIHFIVKWPGGIWRGKLSDKVEKDVKTFKIKNDFGHQIFDLNTAGFGGSSGIWFMSDKMMKKFRWEKESIFKAYGRFKTHDTGAWGQIKRTFGKIHYVAAVVPPYKENPLILHIGDIIGGSICNKLENHKRVDLLDAQEKDIAISELSVAELFNKYKDKCYMW